jgi:hypothetical protein
MKEVLSATTYPVKAIAQLAIALSCWLGDEAARAAALRRTAQLCEAHLYPLQQNV